MRRTARFFAGFTLLAAAPSLVFAQTVDLPVEEIEPSTVVTEPVEDAPPPATVAPKPAPPPVPTKPALPVPKKKAFSDGLKPGQYIWEKRASQAKDLRIVVVLDIQRIYVFDGGTLVAFSSISSGKKGHATPTGSFKILQKNVDHKSNLYSNAPMPFMQRLTWDGIALHAGHIPGYPASHGCLRLPLAFAKSLYGITTMDQVVTVLPDLSSPAPKPDAVVEPETESKPEVTLEGDPKIDPVPPLPKVEQPQ